MKYLAVLDDNFLSNFRLDDNGLTLVMQDKQGYNRAVELKPIIRPVLTVTEDCGGHNTTSVYLSDEHIKVLKEYDEKTMIKEVIERMSENLKDVNKTGINSD